MKILAYEHITGGMLADAEISALAPEGEAMLRALLDDLTAIPGTEVSVLRDVRLEAKLPVTLYAVGAGAEFWPTFRRALNEADAVWPIAPEQGGALLKITDEILRAKRILLGCRPDAIRIATSKRATADVLARAGINVIPAYADENSIPSEVSACVVKPDDGAGCQDTLLFRSRPKLRDWLRQNAKPGLIFQPYIAGDARSLSLLCCGGRARLLACNRQKVGLAADAFEFAGVSVAAVEDVDQGYTRLADAVARALPGLWGYCGVDFVETNNGPIVLEVNPRLTTSYAGLRRAIGINPAQLVLELPSSLDVAARAVHRTRAVEVDIAHAG